MLLRLTIENILCFRDEVVFSMIASKDEKHPTHLISSAQEDTPVILRAAAIYGANGHGKTRFVEAISALKDLVCDGISNDENIRIPRFRLDPKSGERGSKFIVEFRRGDYDYEYGIHFDPNRVREEWLFRSDKGKKERMVFERVTNEDHSHEMTFSKDLLKSKSPSKKVKMGTFLDVISDSMPANQVFLKEAVSRGVNYLQEALDWFKYALTPISADSFYTPLHSRMREDEQFIQSLSTFLSGADVGISRISLLQRDVDDQFISSFPEAMVVDLKELQDGEQMSLGNADGSVMVFSKSDDKIMMSQVEMIRKDSENKDIRFDLDEESSGTRRLVDLFPMLSEKNASDRVFIVDEVDRKLHTLLARNLLCDFLEAGRNQLIYTTHNTHLLDLSLLRRDEIWFVQKKQDGSSEMYSLADMRVRPDLDVRKGYLNGRFGGIPFLGNLHDLGWVEKDGHDI